MREILDLISAGSYVLDLGSAAGSFEPQLCQQAVIRADISASNLKAGDARNFVQCCAAHLPFRPGIFHAIICNNSLEHFDDLDGALSEIKRVIRDSGVLFVTVPDASALTDRIYRWLARGGGHVNRFTNSALVAERIERVTGLRHRATRVLCTSFSFANRKNRRSRPPLKLLLLGGGCQWTLVILTYILRLIDRWCGTRTSIYGWALYFGGYTPREVATKTNVCVRCGAGHSARWLAGRGATKRICCFRMYRCPLCMALNLYTTDLS